MIINNNLSKYRNLADYKQRESAKFLNISTRQYQRFEKETPKSVIQFYNLAKLYNTTIDDLLKQDDDEQFKLGGGNSSGIHKQEKCTTKGGRK